MDFSTRENIGKKSLKYFGSKIDEEIRNNVISWGIHKLFSIPEEVNFILIYKNLHYGYKRNQDESIEK